MRIPLQSLAILILVTPAAALGDPIQITDAALILHSRDSTSDANNSTISDVSLPYSDSDSVASGGGSSASATYDFSATDASALFDFQFDLARSGTIDSQSFAVGDIFFDATEDSVFIFDGLFDLIGDPRIRVDIKLRDLTIGGGAEGIVFQSLQQSLSTANEQFVLGGMSGDSMNELIGDLTGNLIAGHSYLLDYSFDIITPADGDLGAMATGSFGLQIFSDVVSVPEPGTLGLLGIGLFALGFLRGRNKV